MSQFIRVERRDSCLEIVLDRPDKKNAVLTDMYEAMTRALEESLRDPSISSVLFRGEGPAFCAGNDLKDFVQTPPTGPRHRRASSSAHDRRRARRRRGYRYHPAAAL